MARKGNYLIKREGSANWYLQLQYPPVLHEKFGRKKVKSLGTSDYQLALQRAQDDIYKFRWQVAFGRNMAEGTFKETRRRRYPDGKHVGEDGREFLAKGDVLVRIGETGLIEEENPLVVDWSMTVTPDEAEMALELRDENRKLKKGDDEELIQLWKGRKKVEHYVEADTRRTLALLHKLTNNKGLKNCTQHDGMALATELLKEGNAWATTNKKISYLRSMVSIAVKLGKMTMNPFSSVMPDRNTVADPKKILPLSEDDMAVLGANLDDLSPHDQLLFKFLAITGARLSEPFQITSEDTARGIRFVEYGTKTKQSRRRIPLPTALLPLLPAKIEGPLFEGDPETVGKRLRYWMRKHGVSYDPKRGTGSDQKRVHSLRHRAQTIMRELDFPDQIRFNILGHEEITAEGGYGAGPSMAKLQPYLDRITWTPCQEYLNSANEAA